VVKIELDPDFFFVKSGVLSLVQESRFVFLFGRDIPSDRRKAGISECNLINNRNGGAGFGN
jgi:hypothetical protein